MGQGKYGRIRVLNILKTSVGAPWAWRQMRDMVQLGVDVHVALPPSGSRIPEYEAAGVTVHPLELDFPVREPWGSPVIFKKFRNLVVDVNPDIIQSHHVGTTLTMRLALGKHHPIPRIFQVPGPLHLEYSFFRNAELATAGQADYWIGTCHWISERYKKSGISEQRLFVSDYGVDIEAYIAYPKGKLRQEVGVAPETKLIGMVGLMYAPKRFLGQTRGLKGHEDLIDALKICLENGANIAGVFIGGAWNNAAWYEQRVRTYGQRQCGNRAIFLGTRSDVPRLLPDFDIAVQPSHTEGVAATAVEAQLLNIPVVATAVGGQPDLVRHRETGLLVPPHNPDKLAEAILELLANPTGASTMSAHGRERARRLFNGREQSRQVLDIYQTILGTTEAHDVPMLWETTT